MTREQHLRLAIAWRSRVERWSKKHARLMLPSALQSGQSLTALKREMLILAGLVPHSERAQERHVGSILPPRAKLGMPIDDHPNTQSAYDLSSLFLSAPPPLVPKVLLPTLKLLPPSPNSAVIESEFVSGLSTTWVPLTPAYIDQLLITPPWQNWSDDAPQGPPVFPDVPFDGPLVGPIKGWERICCAGIDHDSLELNAIVEILRVDGYSVDRCHPDQRENVGFWLVEPSISERQPMAWVSEPDPNVNGPGIRYVGTGSFLVTDIDRNIAQDVWNQYVSGILHYSVRVPLSGDDLRFMLRCVERARLPRLHVVLGWDQTVGNEHYNGRGIVFGDVYNGDIEYPVLRRSPCKIPQTGVTEVYIDPAVTAAAPVHVAHLPDGRILFFSGGHYQLHDDANPDSPVYKDSCAVFDPSTNQIENVGTPPFDLFCSGHSVLANGNLLVVGGTTFGKTHAHRYAVHWPGLNDAAVFDHKTMTFRSTMPMYEGRWYPSTLVLGTGDVYVMDGHPSTNQHEHTNFRLEIYSRDGGKIVHAKVNANPSTGSIDESINLDGDLFIDPSGEKRRPQFDEEFVGLYPRIVLLPNGKVFSASILRSLSIPLDPPVDGYAWRKGIPIHIEGYAIDPKTGNRILRDNSYAWDPLQPWEITKVFEGDPGSGPLFNYNHPAVLLPIVINPSTNTYNESDVKVMTFVNGRAYVIQPLLPQAQWKEIQQDETHGGPKHRVHGNIVLLPNKRAMIVGGVNIPWRQEGYTNEDEEANFNPDIDYIDFNVSASGGWIKDAHKLRIPRRYHSTAILLGDGRVFVGGSDREIPNGVPDDPPVFQPICEIITPSNMIGKRRPAFIAHEGKVTYGSRVKVTMLEGWQTREIAYYSLIRHYSVTHAFAYDQRMIVIYPHGVMRQFDIELLIPDNPSLLPPGPYWLFAINHEGVPSCGHVLYIG